MGRKKSWILSHRMILPTSLALTLVLLAFPVVAQDEPEPEAETEPEEAPAEGEEAAPEEGASEEEAPAETPPVEEPPALEEAPAEPEPEPEEAPPEEEVEEGEIIDETAEPEVEEGEPEEEIVVTGTRIGRSNLEDYAQITVLDSEDIEISGVTSIEQLLSYMPSVTLGGVSSSVPTNWGYAMVDLRNLGTARTLVLLNGRRVASANLNDIPVAMIERVEVLLDGASAIYGSDAISGVVNIILKEDFNGFAVEGNTGISGHGDGLKGGISATWGANSDKGNVTTNLSYNHREGILHKDRDWANPPCETVSYNLAGEVQSVCGSTTHPGGNAEYLGYANSSYMIDYPDYVVFQGPNADWHLMQPYYETWLQGDQSTPYDIYNWGEQQALTGTIDQFNIVSNGHYEMNEWVTAYFSAIYSYIRNAGRYAGEPVSDRPGTLFGGPLLVHISSPFIPESYRTEIIDGYGINYNLPYLQMRKRTNDIGARVFDQTSNTFNTVVGLRGEITPDYKWDVFFNYSRSQRISVTNNSPDMQRFQIAIDPEACYAMPGCVLANLFGEGVMQDEVRDFIGFDSTESSQWDAINPGAYFLMQPFELPGGKFAIVIGGDLRWESDYELPDSKVQDGVSGTNQDSEYEGSYNAQEAYIELRAPILADIPAVNLLETNLAGRASHYNVFGTEFTYRAQLLYAPIEDIRLRGVYSTSYRAPSITDVVGPYATGFPSVTDPCHQWWLLEGSDVPSEQLTYNLCMEEGVPNDYTQSAAQIMAYYGPNPDLKPETSTTVNLGTVIQPTFMPRSMPLSLTFDWYNIWLYDAITTLDPAEIMRNCYTVDGLQGYCDYIERNETGKPVIYASRRNIGEIQTSGFDFTFQLGFPIWQTLKGQVAFQGNILKEYVEINPEDVSEEGAPSVAENDLTGQIYAAGGGYPKFRFISEISFGTSVWRLNNRVRYIHGMTINGTEEGNLPITSVDAVAYWDIGGSLHYEGWFWGVGCDNVLEKEPPYLPGSGYNANLHVYDNIGRYFWTKLGYTFQ